MADVNRGDRPLSPHLQIYRPQITMVLSILHRITGVALTFSMILLVWWFFAGASSAADFETADAILTSPVGIIVLLSSAFGLTYHTFNGIRHLFWDAGFGYDLDTVTTTGWAVVFGAIAATVILLLIAVA
ncbi:MAG: succinate dehydrogenase, cytochrome b556 subunit [Rhodobacteraceae bacterium]|nr:succinate dehydrogenase, cytochrome b556 subunit [Paracoccaceae bacterium]